MSSQAYSASGFYAANRENYGRMWGIFGRQWTDLATEAAWAEANVPGDKFGQLKIELDVRQQQMLLPIMTDMRFFDPLTIEPGDYNGAVVSGAKFIAMVGRWEALRQQLEIRDHSRVLYMMDRIVCLFGHRPREDSLDGTVAEITNLLPARVLQHPWVVEELKKSGLDPSRLGDQSWVVEELTKIKFGLYQGPFSTEFHLGILAVLIAYNSDVVVTPYEKVKEESFAADIPAREAASVTLILPDSTPVDVLNAPPVERPHGAPRPTTISSTGYWLERYAPVPHARVVLVSGPTHGFRMTLDFQRRVHATRPDVIVFCVSRPTPNPEAVLNNAIAEAIWILVKAATEEKEAQAASSVL